MDDLFKVTAMSLDTLPQFGRIMLLALLLSIVLSVFARILPARYGDNTHILFRKAALLALIGVPLLVWLTDLRMTVYVVQAETFESAWPRLTTTLAVSLWLLGVVVSGRRLWRKIDATRAEVVDNMPGEKLRKRLGHWQGRLNINAELRLVVGGAQEPWHTRGTIVLPAAALNWPSGVVDAMLLLQLAQIKQRCWHWMLLAQGMLCLFWFAPWVKKLVAELLVLLPRPAVGLARAAYRDPEGWRRDVRQVQRRLQTMAPVGDERDPLLRLDPGLEVAPGFELDKPGQPWPAEVGGAETMANETTRWDQVRHRYWRRHFDPYERVFWLVAGASLLVAFCTTLTIERSPPEFEPRFLEIKWQDQMQPRIEREVD
jgi:hypothetical protein